MELLQKYGSYLNTSELLFVLTNGSGPLLLFKRVEGGVSAVASTSNETPDQVTHITKYHIRPIERIMKKLVENKNLSDKRRTRLENRLARKVTSLLSTLLHEVAHVGDYYRHNKYTETDSKEIEHEELGDDFELELKEKIPNFDKDVSEDLVVKTLFYSLLKVEVINNNEEEKIKGEVTKEK